VTSINAYDEYGIPAASNVGREFGGYCMCHRNPVTVTRFS
jgi:hypothetical protein